MKKFLLKIVMWLLKSLEDGKITQDEVKDLIKQIKDLKAKQ